MGVQWEHRHARTPDKRVTLGIGLSQGWIDAITFESVGRILIGGWWRQRRSVPKLLVRLDDTDATASQTYRCFRPDVALHLGEADPFLGFIHESSAEWSAGTPTCVRIFEQESEVCLLEASLPPVTLPHYGSLFDQGRVLKRSDIYGSGPPSPHVTTEVLAIVEAISRRTLDFGCGTGALVRALRGRGVDAHGIELRRAEIEAALESDVRPFVQLYDGRLPTGYGTGAFSVVTCCEVLEHIEDYEGVLDEIFRVASETVVLTVPDMSAIPSCFPHHVVPWHLLESTHVNFFTQESLRTLLSPRCRSLSFARIGGFDVNGTRVHTSIVALCEL
jgi:SAM-dependent methyltransferase